MRISSRRCSTTKKAFCGYGWPITNIPERHYSSLENIKKKLFAKPTTAFSAVMTPTWRPTWRFPHPTTGRASTKISGCMYRPASHASKEKEQRTSRHHCSPCQYQKGRTGESMLTYWGRCWQPTATKNLCYASQMHSPNMLWSHQSRIKMLKQLLMPSSKSGSVNSEFLLRFTPMEERNLWTSFQLKWWSSWMYHTPELRQLIRNATHKVKCLTKW